MFGVIEALTQQMILSDRQKKIERSRAQARINLEAYSYMSSKIVKAKEEMFWAGIIGNEMPVSASKCNCCGSLDFVKHHSNIICSYCRTPKYVR